MLNLDQINEIHRLAGGEHWSLRRIARQLHLAARTVKKYLAAPVPSPVRRPRPSKLDPFKPLVAELLEQDPRAPGVVILQRLRAAGEFPLARVDLEDPGGTCAGPGRLVACSVRRTTG